MCRDCHIPSGYSQDQAAAAGPGGGQEVGAGEVQGDPALPGMHSEGGGGEECVQGSVPSSTETGKA